MVIFICLKLRLCPSTTTVGVPYIEFDRENKEYHGNKPSGECTLAHSSIREGHYIFSIRKELYCFTYVQYGTRYLYNYT